MKKAAYLLLPLAAALGGGIWFYQQAQETEAPMPEPQIQPVQPEETASASSAPAIQHPIPQAAAEASPPAAATPAAELEELLIKALGNERFQALFMSDLLIQRIVASVDNLPRPEAPARMYPLRAPGGSFRVNKTAADLHIAADNASRYAKHMQLLEVLSPATAARIYIQLYPRFQQTYVSLGYPKGYFNDRLVETLDNLLATPESTGELALIQPKVLYQFADPNLQAASAGQKILLRMGPENSHKIKQWLGEFRKEVSHR